MTGKTHQIVGISAGVGYFLYSFEPQYSPATFGVILFGSHLFSLLPDLDRSTAKFWEFMPYGKVLGKITDPFVKHRNITHSLLGFIIIGFLLQLLLQKFPEYWGINIHAVFISILVAYASHIVCDCLTVEGVPLFFPLKTRVGFPPFPFDGARIMTGKWFENLIIFPIINIVLISLMYFNWQEIRTILFK
ncbi:MAG: Membrane protein containing DUF457, transmembrane [Candidatus Berkelbacteria bacterium Licking1014_85]|uniref:Membrane protein containing DUF457, transmembrane n=1 Tax=Candidatus Berkelbacteria bacterium Licking1014_85 TaxID=2017148 RepID=A0A554LMQ0_9BACT|nr:MAG: Membrane protein containing DUF457, transmembrane [Candidatus Berkelbacteria bacterium Licking1014_85]